MLDHQGFQRKKKERGNSVEKSPASLLVWKVGLRTLLDFILEYKPVRGKRDNLVWRRGTCDKL